MPITGKYPAGWALVRGSVHHYFNGESTSLCTRWWDMNFASKIKRTSASGVPESDLIKCKICQGRLAKIQDNQPTPETSKAK